jgi:hypothetical protein
VNNYGRKHFFIRLPKDPSKFSFDFILSSFTFLGIIFRLLSSGNLKASIIGSLPVIASADNSQILLVSDLQRDRGYKKGKHKNVLLQGIS